MTLDVQELDANVDSAAEEELTDGFHLLIDALQLNGLNTIYGVPGIPITDLGRLAQAQGMRVVSFRHEQHAGNAAAIAGYLTKKPGLCLTVSAPGFLNGLTVMQKISVLVLHVPYVLPYLVDQGAFIWICQPRCLAK